MILKKILQIVIPQKTLNDMTQEEIENYAYQVRRKYQDEQAEL